MPSVKQIFFLPLCWLLSLSVSAAAPAQLSPAVSHQFTQLLNYELQNRAFSLRSVTRLAQVSRGKPDAELWAAYLRLEVLNQTRYQTVAQQYAITLAASPWSNLKSELSVWYLRVFPRSALKMFSKATAQYVPELETLAALPQAQDQVFFEYALQQEQIQAQALALAVQGQFDKAAELMNEFVDEQEKTLAGG